jgi:1-acyl-sn-glycerol-3-phosphate acyltransferase
MFILFPFVILASFFGRIRGGNIIYHICRFWADAAMFLWGIRHRNIYESPHNPNHPVVFVFNHISYMDIPVILATFRKQPIRILAKAEMSKIPIFGFIYKSATVMVDRSDAEHRIKSVAILKSVLRKNISVVIAPEGTFNMTHEPLKSFYDGAFRIAIETQTPIKPVIFLDTYDRLNYASIFSLTPGRSRSVFLQEISVSSYTVENLAELKQTVFAAMESALIKYNASWIIKS